VQKHDGSVIPALNGQNEAVAGKDIEAWEILGHYAGKRFHEETAEQGAQAIGAGLLVANAYSYAIGSDQFISGLREGNATTCINCFTTYLEEEDKKTLPEQNVLFVEYTNDEGIIIPFVIAIKPITQGDRLWLDYGQEYWDATRTVIDVDETDSTGSLSDLTDIL